MAIDNTIKKENLVESMVVATRQLLDSLDKLAQLKSEFTQLSPAIGSSDTFTRASIQHVDGYMVNNVLTTVIPAIQTLVDANSGTYKNALFQVK